MLEGLSDIDWSKLSHAYGEASDVPDLIRALASNSKEEHKRALHKLHGNIWNQNTIYEGTSYCVPFFVEILDSPDFKNKFGILILLWNIATGNSSDNFIELVREGVADGYGTYIRLLDSSEVEVQVEAAWILAECQLHQSKIEVIFKQKLYTESNVIVASNLLRSLVNLWRGGGFDCRSDTRLTNDQRDYLRKYLDSDMLGVQYVTVLSLLRDAHNAEFADLLEMMSNIIERPLDEYLTALIHSDDWRNLLSADIFHATEHQPKLAFAWFIKHALHKNDNLRNLLIGQLDNFYKTWRWAIDDTIAVYKVALFDSSDKVRITVSAALSHCYPYARELKVELERAVKDEVKSVQTWARRTLDTIAENGTRYTLQYHLTPRQILESPIMDDAILGLQTHLLIKT